LPWEKDVPAEEQERYKQHNKCKMHSVFERNNDWNIIKLEKRERNKNADDEDDKIQAKKSSMMDMLL
jgi:hypothetical protein